jgi:hypothetical protein
VPSAERAAAPLQRAEMNEETDMERRTTIEWTAWHDDRIACATRAFAAQHAPADLRPLRTRHSSLHHDERGAVSVFLVFGVLALVLLFGALLDTARQTTRKVEMQGAADASAVAGGAWVARGMNLVAFNNSGMADVLAVMVVVHSYNMTLEYSNIVVTAICTGLESNPFTAAFGAAWRASWEAYYNATRAVVDPVDDFLQSVGWDLMRAMDLVNQGLREVVGPMALAGAKQFAVWNGAQREFLLPRETDSFERTMPSLPIDRGPQQRIAVRAEQCPEPALSNVARVSMLASTLSIPIVLVTYEVMLEWNWSNLQGNGGSTSTSYDRDQMIDEATNQTIDQVANDPQRAVAYLDEDLAAGGARTQQFMANNPNLAAAFGTPPGLDAAAFSSHLLQNPDVAVQYVRETRFDEIRSDVESGFDAAGADGTFEVPAGGAGGDMAPLEWPDKPPKPMVLDVDGDDDTVDDDHEKVAKYLQYLSVAWAEMRPSPIGPTRMINRAPYGWMTYAEAHVYNPSRWDMFVQDWRVKLVPAASLDEQFDDLRERASAEFGVGLGSVAGSPGDWGLVNNH